MKEKKGEHPFGDTGQLISFFEFLIVWIGDSFFLRASTFLSEDVPLYIRLLILGLIMLCAYYLAKSGHVVVSHNQGPERLLSTGVFHYVRHPLYLATLLFYLGLVVSTVSLLSLALLVVIFIFYDYISRYEEEFLEGKYGEDYRRYRERTGKWIPNLKSIRRGA